MTNHLQESRMREICTSGLTRGSAGTGLTAALHSLLYCEKNLSFVFVWFVDCFFQAPKPLRMIIPTREQQRRLRLA